MSKKSTILNIPPEQIRINEENPRIHFPEQSMQNLAASINKEGVLVPISVYKRNDLKTKPYILVDGERRWKCSLELGLPAIPAIIGPAPNPTQNLLRMFNIHMVREEWKDMPTAWALGKIINRTGIEDPAKLMEMTGLSRARIDRLLFALTLPHDYQELIDTGEVPLNFFYELKTQVINPLRTERPRIYKKFGEDRILRSFVGKKISKVTRDTVELRRMRPIISIAATEAGGPEGKSELDQVIEDLIRIKKKTIQDAYEDTVEMVVEAGKFSRQCQQLIVRYDYLMKKAVDQEDRALIISALERLQAEVKARLKEMSLASH